MDASTDAHGRVHVRELFGYVRSIQDPAHLRRIQEAIGRAKGAQSGQEAAEEISDADPELGELGEALREISPALAVALLNIFFTVLGLLIAYRQSSLQQQANEISRQGVELNQEQFEYQKEKDAEDKVSRYETEKRLDALESQFKEQINRAGQKAQPRQHRATLKGSQRNKPCLCGSGQKAKHCHPQGC